MYSKLSPGNGWFSLKVPLCVLLLLPVRGPNSKIPVQRGLGAGKWNEAADLNLTLCTMQAVETENMWNSRAGSTSSFECRVFEWRSA